MDILSSLPPEVSQKILLFLSVRDLFNCMTVCKSWRCLINCNYIWGHFYKVFDIEELHEDELYLEEEFSLLPLCGRAKELKNYLCSSAYNWSRGNSQHLYVYLQYRHWKFVCYEPYMAVIYLPINELHIYHISRSSIVCKDIVSVNLPRNSIEQPLLMNSKYIVLGSYNITHVFKLGEETFILYRTFALKYDPVLYDTDDDFDEFVKQNVLPNHCVFERALVDDKLWITDISGNKHIVDLKTGAKTIFSTSFLNTRVLSSSKFIFNFINDNVLITDSCGNTVCKFPAPDVHKSFYINSTIVAVALPRLLEGNMFPVECREIITGNLIRKISVPDRTRVALHSKDDILFSLTTVSNLYTVSSLCIKSGNYLWKYEANTGPHLFWGSYLSTVCNRYFFIYPSPSSDYFYALFNHKGKLLNEKPFSAGILLYFSDNLVVALIEGRLLLTFF